jgi:acyl dehydratase
MKKMDRRVIGERSDAVLRTAMPGDDDAGCYGLLRFARNDKIKLKPAGGIMNNVWMKPPVALDAYLKMVGQEIGVSKWHTLDQKRIDQFADVIEDHQYIHIDPVRAKDSAFGTTVAHGFLTMSMMSIFSYEVMPSIEGATMSVNYGLDKLRFISPVKSGSRVRGRFILAEAKLRKPNELFSRTMVTVEIEGETKPAIAADWIGLIYLE